MNKTLTNILFVDCEPFYGEGQQNLLTIITHLDSNEYQPFVLGVDDGDFGLLSRINNFSKKIATEKIPIRYQHLHSEDLSEVLQDLSRFRGLTRKWFWDYDIDLVYANGFNAALMTSLSIPNRMPLLVHLREGNYRYSILERIIQRSSRTVVVSEHLQHQIESHVNDNARKKLRAITDAIDFTADDTLREAFPLREFYYKNCDYRFVAMIGEMVSGKHHELFLESFALALKKESKLFAFIIGGAFDQTSYDYLDRLESKAKKLGILNRIAFMEYVDNYHPIIAICDAVISVSHEETSGMGLIQALAADVPVVVIKGSAAHALLKDCRVVQAVEDRPEQIAEGILFWPAQINNGKYQKDKEKAFAHAEKFTRRFAVSNQLKKFYDLIDDCLV